MPMAVPEEQSDYRVIVMGEGPGEQEDNYGKPFVGTTGQLLRGEIPSEWKRKLYWTNAVRCRPHKNRTPAPVEVQCCSVYNERDISIIKPHAILAVGDVALKYFWPAAWVNGMRGIPIPYRLDDGSTTWVVSTFHPSFVTRSEREDYATGITTNSVLPVFKNDLDFFFRNIPNFAANPPVIPEIPKNFLYPKTKLEVLNLFNRLKSEPAFDIETTKLKAYLRDARPLTASFSDGETTFAFPVNWPGHMFDWGLETLREILSKKIKWICQHSTMEYGWSWFMTGTHEHDFDDIEIKARLLLKRKGIGSLDELSRIFLGYDIKQIGPQMDKTRLVDYPIQQVLEYNNLDSWGTKIIDNILTPQLTDVDIANYERSILAVKSTVAMEIKGLHVDTKASESLQKEYLTKMHEFEAQGRDIREVRQFEQQEQKIFRMSATEMVGHIIVSYCGLDLPKTAGSAKPGAKQVYSTDEQDLTPLIGKHPFVDLVLDYREVSKLLSTYINPILTGEILGIDGLIHPSYTVVHTWTYRLSSEFPNIQNFPKRKNKQIRRQVVAPPGYVLAAFDYGQLEGRVLGMASRDKALAHAMIEQAKAIAANDAALIEKWDIHYKWLYRILEKYPQYMDRLAKKSGETQEKKIIKAGRTIIKTDFVFASFYGSVAKSVANRTEIPLEIVDEILNKEFWVEYSGAKKWVDGQFAYYKQHGEVQSITGRVRNSVLPGNEVINTPIQGTAAEVVLEAQNALFLRGINEDIHLLPRINIHDDLVFILPDTNDLEQYIITIGNEIVKPRFPFITIPLMTECRVGYDWASLESVTNFVGEYYA